MNAFEDVSIFTNILTKRLILIVGTNKEIKQEYHLKIIRGWGMYQHNLMLAF